MKKKGGLREVAIHEPATRREEKRGEKEREREMLFLSLISFFPKLPNYHILEWR